MTKDELASNVDCVVRVERSSTIHDEFVDRDCAFSRDIATRTTARHRCPLESTSIVTTRPRRELSVILPYPYPYIRIKFKLTYRSESTCS